MSEKSKSRGCFGWFIALIVLAAVILAVVYMVKSKMNKSDDDEAGPVPGPPGAIDKKYADALKLALQFFDIQKCTKNSPLLPRFLNSPAIAKFFNLNQCSKTRFYTASTSNRFSLV